MSRIRRAGSIIFRISSVVSVLKKVITFSCALQGSGSGRFSLNQSSIFLNVFSSYGLMIPSDIIRQHMLKIPLGYFVIQESSLPWIRIYLQFIARFSLLIAE